MPTSSGTQIDGREVGLQAQHPPHGLVQPVLADAARAHSVTDALDERHLPFEVAGIVVVVLLRQHHDVDAGVDGLGGGVDGVVVGAHRVHVHGVGDDRPLEAQLAAQDLVQDHP